MKIKIKAVKCPECKDIIYSRANHDFRRCQCKKTFIDGGPGIKKKKSSQGIIRTSASNLIDIELEFDNIGVCESILYNDYNEQINKYGKIEGQNEVV